MKYENVNIKFELSGREELLGESQFYLNKTNCDYLKKFYEEEPDLNESVKSLLSEMEFTDDVYSSDTDCFIIFMNALLESEQEFSVTVNYVHIIWLFHDLAHVRYDASDSDIYVDQGEEERAIRASIRLCKENHIDVPWYILTEVEDAFYERFNSPLHLDDLQSPGQSDLDTSGFTFNELN